MAVIDRIKWDGSPHLLAWKFPSADLSTWTQLVVNETQEAFVVSGGVYDGPFTGGRYTLNTENIPLVRRVLGLAFGGSSPFTAEVWFVNKTVKMDMKWGTPDPVYIEDPKYKIMIPVRAYGQYGIQIDESKKFLMKLVGTVSQFNSDILNKYFNGILLTKIKAFIAQYFVKRDFSILDIHTNIEELSNEIQQAISPLFMEFGVATSHFYVHSVNIPDDDPAVVSLRSALAKKAEMGILGFDYKQERSFDVLEAAAGSNGAAGTMMGAGLGMGMGMGMGSQVSQIMNQAMGIPQTPLAPPTASAAAIPAPGAPAPADPRQIIEIIREYAQLQKDGIITDEEFQAQKKKLLGI
jgi:membrane protease subunit (stomatin/prohibitin family)